LHTLAVMRVDRVSADRGAARALLPGLRVGALAFVAGTVAFGWVELHEHPERWRAWVLANGLNLGMLTVAMWARMRLRTRTAARALGVGLVVALAAVMAGYTVIEQSSSRLLASGLIILLAGVSLLVPLGPIGQAVAALGAITTYVASLGAGADTGGHVGLSFVALISAAGVSVLGAFLSARARADARAASAAARSAADVATTLIEIGRELNATLQPAEVLRRLADWAAAVFDAPIGAINLIDDARRMRIVAVSGLPAAEADAARDLYVDLDMVPGAWELLGESLIELPDVGAQRRFPAAMLQQFGYHGLLIAPMRRGENILGAVTFMYREPRAPFSDSERQLACGLAEQAALALENARLYEEQQEAAETAQALVRVAEVLGSTLDPQQVSDDLARLAVELLGCDRAAVYRCHDGHWRLAASATPQATLDPKELGSIEFRDADFAFFRALRRDHLVEIPDSEAQDLVPAALLRRMGARSSLTVLLARAANPLGLIVVAHGERVGAFSARERRVLTGLAQLGVIALTNAQLAEQLRHANSAKSEFVAAMSHELRTPLNAILGYTDLLREEALGPLLPQQIDALERTRARSLDLLQLVQATLDLNRLEAGVPTVERQVIGIGEFVESVRAQIPARWLKPEVRLEFHAEAPETPLWTDAGKLHAVARNLIHNALKFTERGSVTMTVRPCAQHGNLLIEVRDTGCGIPPDDIGPIFEMFAQGGNAAAHDGVGLGLHLSRRFITLLGGHIDVESRVGEGSLFRVELPLEPAPTAAERSADRETGR
jgi:signal transduction histidine kinase